MHKEKIKKHIVRILLKLNLDNLAYKISPTFYYYYCGITISEKFLEGFNKTFSCISGMLGCDEEKLIAAIEEVNKLAGARIDE